MGAETEDRLSDMVVAGTVSAKTDRLEGIVDFTEQQDPLENLNTWSYNTNKLMDLVMKTTHPSTRRRWFTKLWEQELWQRQSDLSLLISIFNPQEFKRHICGLNGVNIHR